MERVMLNVFKRIKSALLCVCVVLPVIAVAQETVDYKPNIHGALRTRWEMETESGDSRFQVRNARLTVDGRIAAPIDYFIQVDASDRGVMKFLDAWGRIALAPGFQIQAGQFRMPFGVDPMRAPSNYIFANRSYLGKEVCNVRAVGAKFIYSFKNVPLSIEAGAFNPSSIADHEKWHSEMAYSGKVTYKWGNVSLNAGVKTIIPDSVRINLIDGAVTWQTGRWLVSGEYINKHYTHSARDACHAYVVYADYHFPVNVGVFNQMSVQGRFDGMTDHSSGKRNADGLLTTTDPGRQRITVGATLSYIKGPVHCDIRVDYEKMFFDHDVKAPQGKGDKLLAELVIRF
ncbi:MAG: OprO/OprP family phosphate-selective porin [Muribaculum sp.]|nr:OprO/OprP family phosphate-selective porin [Muribaculum sp.]